MGAYIARRVLLMIPTILGIMFISFVIVQFAPGGPVERIIAQLQGFDTGATGRFSGGGSDVGQSSCDANGGRRRRRIIEISRRAGARSKVHRRTRKAVRLRQTGLGAFSV